jgi:hypothetical protein
MDWRRGYAVVARSLHMLTPDLSEPASGEQWRNKNQRMGVLGGEFGAFLRHDQI